MNIAILGRQPALSLAELEACFGADCIKAVGSYAALVDIPENLPQARLGGTMKSAKVLNRLENTDLNGAFSYLATNIPDHLESLPEGKLQFGLSIYGDKAQKNWLLKQMLSLKKIIKKSGRSVRIIENKSEELESAQVLYNKLTGPLGWELLLIRDGKDIILAQTTAVQDIDAYSKRDFGRPMRDAYVGMLPPKLAQIMLNLAISNAKIEELEQTTPIVLDAFCGTGVIPQEALLMGLDVIATDLEPRMLDYTKKNLSWLQETHEITGQLLATESADATTHHWPDAEQIDFVVSETYLGKPLTSLPNEFTLTQIMSESNEIASAFLKNISPQLKSGSRLCIAVPAWSKNNDFLHLKMLDHVTDMGYNRIDLKHATKKDLIYHRTDQIVARELILLEKK